MKKKVLESLIDGVSYESAVDQIINLTKLQSSYVCLVNVHMLIEAYDDIAFQKVVNEADLALPDGMPVAKSIQFLYGKKQERVPGMDLLESLLKKAESDGMSVFLYGSTDEVLESVVRKAEKELPNLKIDFYSPPFRELSDIEKNEIIEMINNLSPDLVMVALGCPKQEKWMYAHKNKIKSCMVGVGGALPVYANKAKRAPLWMQNSGLEWLYRFYQEPKRLWRRYFYTNTKFLVLIVVQLLKVKVFKGNIEK